MPSCRGSRTICLSFEGREHYDACVADVRLFRGHLETQYQEHPELFPVEMGDGFSPHSSRISVKRALTIRRIRLKASGDTYQIRPSFIMPYMVAFTDEVEKPLYLRRCGVSFEALEYLFGHNHMNWHRVCTTVGRLSVVTNHSQVRLRACRATWCPTRSIHGSKATKPTWPQPRGAAAFLARRSRCQPRPPH